MPISNEKEKAAAFDKAVALVLENIQDFEMDSAEALSEAKKELAENGSDNSGIDWTKVSETAATAVNKTDDGT